MMQNLAMIWLFFLIWLVSSDTLNTRQTEAVLPSHRASSEASIPVSPVVDDEDTDPVKIGLLLPEKPENDRLAMAAWQGAALAAKQAGRSADNRGLLFRLKVRTTNGRWGAASREAVGSVYEDEVCAILSALDSRNAHLVEQVITKAHIVQVETRATEETLTEAFVPWFFRIVPDDRQQAGLLCREIFDRKGLKNILLVTGEEPDYLKAAETFRKVAGAAGYGITGNVTFNKPEDFSFAEANASNYNAVVIYGSPDQSAPVLEKIRSVTGELPVFGPLFITMGGTIAKNFSPALEGGVFVTSKFCFTTPGQAFRKAFKEEYGQNPGPASSYAYDGMNLLIRAIRSAGTDPEKIHDFLADLRLPNGSTGSIRFDEHGNRISPAFLVQIIRGHPVILNTGH